VGVAASFALVTSVARTGDMPGPSDLEVARRLNLPVERVHQLHKQRGLSNQALVQMPRAKLERALWRLDHPMPDSPGEAAKFYRLRAQIDKKGTIPQNALPTAIAKVNAMRNAVAALPPAANVARNVAAAANPAFGAPFRVAGIPVGPLRRPTAPPAPAPGVNIPAAAPARPLTAGISPGGWTWLGPGNIGGRTRSIVVHPKNPATMWAGSVAGGIWKTIDGGATWGPLDDFMASLNVTTLVLDPSDANYNTLYAGTGEGFYNIDGFRGAGIFQSSDGGATWSQLPATTGPAFVYVNRLAISQDGMTLLAAVRNGDASAMGISRSTDKGVTFADVPSVSGTEILDVDFNPSDATKAVAGGRNGKAFYSTDGGATWAAATGLPTVAGFAGRVELAYAANNATIVYASVDNNSGEVYRSNDGGQTYALQNTGTNYLGGQGWYANTLWAGDPTDQNLVVVGGLDLYRSTDGGVTFTQISTWWKAPASPHADHHTIVSHPGFDGTTNWIVYFGNDGGIYQSTNIRTSVDTTAWQALNNNYGITQFYGAAGNPNTGKIVGGAQDNGTLRYTPPPGANTGTQGYTTMFGGDGGYCAADPTDPNFFYGEYVYLQIHRSVNGGASSNDISTGIGDAGNGSQANFIAPFILDPNDPNTMLAGGSSLWKSSNVKAATPQWQALPSDNAGSPISAIAVAQGNSKIIWVGHNFGDVFKSTDGGSTWTKVGSSALPNNRMCTRITIDPSSSDVAYVTFGGYTTDNVWKTTDGGASFNDLGASLPPAPAYTLAIHQDSSNFLYLGMEVGVFASADGGATWSPTNEGPTNCSVNELFWMNRVLTAVTHGRGLFTIDLGNAGPGAGARAQNVPAAISRPGVTSRVRTFEVPTSAANPH
jgi:photosystem II stability/assembly factor-like uncharacterized protein